jgi:dihydroxyacetone kinase-like protein
MSVNFLISQAKNIQIVINENAAEIEALDQNIGDGDHIFNVQRGLKLVVELENDIKNLPLQKGLNMIAMKVLSGIGGSSGALFGTFFMSMAKTPDLDKNIDFNKACEMVITGINAMKERGKADVGEKTMMDVLIPVSEKLNELKSSNHI